MNAILPVVFSFSGDYNYFYRQVCSEFRQMIPKVDLLAYLNTLCRDHGDRFYKVINNNLEAWHVLSLIGPKNANICTLLAETNHTKLFKWAIALGYLPDEDTVERAVEFGNLRMLECIYRGGWIRQDFWFYGYVCDFAAEYNKLDILKWARKTGPDWDAIVLYNSAEKGYLKVLEWALEDGYEMCTEVFYSAAEKGQLRILQWLVENYYSFWDEGVLDAAIQTCQVEIIKYIINNNM
ncbi:Pseudo ankyrin repeat-like [Cedratvirus A11]|uniref:Pseudo ankyrin repeat-like n=1 Tax=Cedratvirus A11 TaxID=1903266 RepID=A0A1M7XUP3_9VIRU|nr:Pseudo ankyrin repeat-like [Cedratvirus A11]SHO33391.1 Pseudo ankyrin repeat-like [Cedratvirus A11]